MTWLYYNRPRYVIGTDQGWYAGPDDPFAKKIRGAIVFEMEGDAIREMSNHKNRAMGPIVYPVEMTFLGWRVFR